MKRDVQVNYLSPQIKMRVKAIEIMMSLKNGSPQKLLRDRLMMLSLTTKDCEKLGNSGAAYHFLTSCSSRQQLFLLRICIYHFSAGVINKVIYIINQQMVPFPQRAHNLKSKSKTDTRTPGTLETPGTATGNYAMLG